jgi:hypothetical protein
MSPAKSSTRTAPPRNTIQPETSTQRATSTTVDHDATPPAITTIPTTPHEKISGSSRTDKILQGVLGGPLPANEVALPKPKGKKRATTVGSAAYNNLSYTRRQEIQAMTSKFISEMKKYASSNNLNPVDVMHHAFGGELKVQVMDTWKTMHWLSSAYRRGCKFFLCTLHL